MTKLLTRLNRWATYGYKYGKYIGILWIISFCIMLPVMFVIGGWQLATAYLICKLTGVCPI